MTKRTLRPARLFVGAQWGGSEPRVFFDPRIDDRYWEIDLRAEFDEHTPLYIGDTVIVPDRIPRSGHVPRYTAGREAEIVRAVRYPNRRDARMRTLVTVKISASGDYEGHVLENVLTPDEYAAMRAHRESEARDEQADATNA